MRPSEGLTCLGIGCADSSISGACVSLDDFVKLLKPCQMLEEFVGLYLRITEKKAKFQQPPKKSDRTTESAKNGDLRVYL